MSTKLAKKILIYIEKQSGDVTYTAIEERAKLRGIDPDVLDQALAKLHRFKKVEQRVIGGEIVYRPTRIKKPTFFSHLTWVRNNYPPMDSSNDGSGIEADYSYMFLTPEDLEKYKAERQGRTYIPSKRYGRKRK